MSRTILVTGTGTGVGKTWVAVRVIEGLRALGMSVAARKPAQSFDPADGATDADILARASGEDPTAVCSPSRWYEAALAPPMAAAALGRAPFSLAEVMAEMEPPGTEATVVEGVGGPRSPLAADADTVDLARALAPDVIVLVSESGLGAINAVMLSVAALPAERVLVFLNRFDGLYRVHAMNRVWLSDNCVAEIATSIDEVVSMIVPEERVVAR